MQSSSTMHICIHFNTTTLITLNARYSGCWEIPFRKSVMATQRKQSDLFPAAVDKKGLHSTLLPVFKSATKRGKPSPNQWGFMSAQTIEDCNGLKLGTPGCKPSRSSRFGNRNLEQIFTQASSDRIRISYSMTLLHYPINIKIMLCNYDFAFD